LFKSNLYILALIMLMSCRSWDASMIAPDTNPISPRLLTLERRIEDMPNTTVVVTYDDEVRLFTKEVETNLVDPYGDKYGYIAFKRSILDARVGYGQYLLSSFLMTVPNLFGMPFMNIRYRVEVEIRILDRSNKLLGRYSAIGNSSVKVAYYYGYSMRNAFRKSYPDAIIDAFEKIRPQIQSDVSRLNERLYDAGKI